MSRSVVAVITVAVVIASPGLATAVVDVIDDGPDATDIVTDGVTEPDADTETTAANGVPTAVDRQSDGPVDVSTGTQLSTVLSTTENEVGSAVSQSVFDSRFAAANESERAALVVERSAVLAAQAEEVADDYRNATAAYRNGTIDRSTYAQRLATVNSRATTIESNVAHLRIQASNVSELALATAGFNESGFEAAASELETASGAAPDALHRLYTGRSSGSAVVEAVDGNGVSVRVQSDGSEHISVQQSTDDEATFTVSQADALSTARGALPEYNWTLTGSNVDEDAGLYEFSFALSSANRTGEAGVGVDGSSGALSTLDAGTEPRTDGDGGGNETDDDADTEPLVLVVADGKPRPNATITLEARQGGTPVADVPVFVDGNSVGTAGADGRITVTLGAEETTVTAERGDSEAELEFEFEETDDPIEGLDVAATLDDGTVTVSITYQSEAVPGAQVSANGETAGTTGPDGEVSFGFDESGELGLTVTRGELEVERTYIVENGTLVEGPASEEGPTDNETVSDLSLSLVDGRALPGATVTVEVTVDGAAAAGVQVSVDGE